MYEIPGSSVGGNSADGRTRSDGGLCLSKVWLELCHSLLKMLGSVDIPA